MKQYSKYVLAFEFGVSFGPVILLWMWGLLAVPVTFIETISGTENYSLFLSAILLGLIGLFGIFTLAKVVLLESITRTPFWVIGIMLLCGIGALFFGLSLDIEPALLVIYFVLPVFCTIHFYYLAYRNLTSKGIGRSKAAPML